MAFMITKSDQKRIDETFKKFNDKKDELQTIFDALDEIRDEIRGVIEDIRDEMQGEYDDKSEKWQDGERASPTQEWIDKLGEIVCTFEDGIEPLDLSDIESAIEEGVPSAPDY